MTEKGESDGGGRDSEMAERVSIAWSGFGHPGYCDRGRGGRQCVSPLSGPVAPGPLTATAGMSSPLRPWRQRYGLGFRRRTNDFGPGLERGLVNEGLLLGQTTERSRDMSV